MLGFPHVIPLPAPIHDRLDAVTAGFLADAGMAFDFATPQDEPELVSADSMS
jgi:hypothetical protein